MKSISSFDRLFKNMCNPLIIFSTLLFILFSFLYLDKPIAFFFHSLSLKTSFPFIVWLTWLGTSVIYVGGLFIIALFFRYVVRNKVLEMRAWFLWLCVFTSSAVCYLLKISLSRARPILLFNDQLYGFFGFQTNKLYWSFPSGHTSTIMGLAFGLCILFPHFFYGWIMVGILVCASRILLTYHFLSDVITAAYLSLFEVGLITYWLKRKNFFIFNPLNFKVDSKKNVL